MQKRRILIVDDEPGFVRLLKLVLEKTGRFIVREENEAIKAAAAALEFKPDLMLVDLVMPKTSGLDVAFKIRSEPLLRETPVVFLSGTVSNKKNGVMEVAGFPALGKPIGTQELLEAIDANLLASEYAA